MMDSLQEESLGTVLIYVEVFNDTFGTYPFIIQNAL